MIVQDKVVIVSGASSGIGEETAKLLAGHGAKVALVARSEGKLREISKSIPESFVVACDLSKEEEVRSMVAAVLKNYGQVDVLINNAGRGYDGPIEKIEMKMLREMIELNFIGPWVAMQEVIPLMRRQGEGAIINISSGTSLMDIPGLAAYSSMKRALNGLSLTAREELAKDNIKVSIVYPYITDTNFGKNVIGGPRRESPAESSDVLPPADPPKLIADKILEVIESGEAEILAHDWMRNIK